ncbi:DUF2171 domain-containing protein [Roseomonas terrae]|uniref:DUF2171 domain-containing protein n=2 Tax=Neoroseomonas terrae TaxID=424799 RepID=A0ABS5EP25_9PROT|nr:DUF2171 domain-containing protein [Neoroseomonas terrae]
MAEKIRERMSVVAADGTHVGTVDQVEGDRIKLTRSDNPTASQNMAGASQTMAGSSQGGHRYLPISSVASVDGDTVRLSTSGAEAQQSAGAQGSTQGGPSRA